MKIKIDELGDKNLSFVKRVTGDLAAHPIGLIVCLVGFFMTQEYLTLKIIFGITLVYLLVRLSIENYVLITQIEVDREKIHIEFYKGNKLLCQSLELKDVSVKIHQNMVDRYRSMIMTVYYKKHKAMRQYQNEYWKEDDFQTIENEIKKNQIDIS